MYFHPDINPVALHIYGPLSIRWYGISYLLGFYLVWLMGVKNLSRYPDLNKKIFTDFIYQAMFGVIIGGRLGYVIFYGLNSFMHNPLFIFKVWQGGMSFHGGLIGVVIVTFVFAKKNQLSLWMLADFIVPFAPIGLFFGRAANFINGELWGRVTDVPWAFIFPQVDYNPRHPTQLYEMFFEGFVLFSIMMLLRSLRLPPRVLTACFMILYALIRFCVEFFREPDPQLGFIIFDFFTMGQLLSVPMILFGLYAIFSAKVKNRLN